MCQVRLLPSSPIGPTLMEPLEVKEQQTVSPSKEDRRLLMKRGLAMTQFSSCSLTEDETSSDGDCDEEEIHLITRPTSYSLVSPSLAFAAELHEASRNPDHTSLVLTDFVERSTRHDIYALRDLLLQDDRHWKTITLQDRCYAPNFRRWAYKKENINHHIQGLCVRRKIPLEYHSYMELNVDVTSVDDALQVLQEVAKHPEVRRLDVVGHLNPFQEERILRAVTALVRLQDRDWDAVNVRTGFAGQGNDDDDQYEAWRATMEHYMGVFSQLYTQYNLPLDIRPCAVH